MAFILAGIAGLLTVLSLADDLRPNPRRAYGRLDAYLVGALVLVVLAIAVRL